jgi:uncharacterized SAM-binding protein YcdF (DUF218 family)
MFASTMKSIAVLLALPPGNLFVLFLAGWIVERRARRVGRALQIAAVLGLYLLSTPLVASRLLASLEGEPLDPPALSGLDHAAIVVLGGDVYGPTPDLGGPTVGALTLERMRYAARLARMSHLPLLVTGGVLAGDLPPLASLMRESFEQDFAIKVAWSEERSGTTAENARYSATILKASGITTVVLVTHAWHMKRAEYAFSREGMKVIPAPTIVSGEDDGFIAFLPVARNLRDSYFALHEWVGLIWYRLAG